MPKLAVSFAVASAVAVSIFAVSASSSAGSSARAPDHSEVQGGNYHTCSEMLACCTKIKDQGTREFCVDQYKQRNGKDSECNLAYDAFQLYCDPDNAPKPPPKPGPVPKPRN